MEKKVWIFLVVAVLGVYFLGKGMTGFVISQSCCFPPDCPEEYLCGTVEKETKETTSLFSITTGLALIVGAVFFLKYYQNKH